MNEIITAGAAEQQLPASARAIQITERIKANGRTAVNAVCAIGKDLRTMKVEKLYTELGYTEFEDYAEKEFQLKRRQAYQYISVFEKLGEDFVQSNAQLGITKLALLAAANPEDRAEVMEQNVEGMTSRELEELLDKCKQQGEQLTLLQEENTKLEARVEELEAEPKNAKAAVEQAKEQAEQDKAQLLKQIDELKKAAEKPAESTDKSSFKSLFASAYKEVTGLIEFIKDTDEEKEVFIDRVEKLLASASAALEEVKEG